MGCGSIPGTGPSGRLSATMLAAGCACKKKPVKHPAVVYAGGTMTVPERPSSSYVPPPVPPRRPGEVRRIPYVPPVQMGSLGTPTNQQQGGPTTAYIPQARQPRQQGGQPQPPMYVYDTPMDDAGTAKETPYIPPVVIKTTGPNGQPKVTVIDVPQGNGGPSSSTVVTSQGGAVPFVNVSALTPVSQNLNPWAEYCADERFAATEICLNGGDADLSAECRVALAAFLAHPDKTRSLRSFVLEHELCTAEFQRILGWVEGKAQSQAAAKASAGLYRASSGMPQYYRASGVISPARIAELRAGTGLPPTDAEFRDPMFAGIAVRDPMFNDNINLPGAGGYELLDPGGGSAQYGGASSWTHDGQPSPVVRSNDSTTAQDVAAVSTGLRDAFGNVITLINNENNAAFARQQLQAQTEASNADRALRARGMEMQDAFNRLRLAATPAAVAADPALALQLQTAQQNLQMANQAVTNAALQEQERQRVAAIEAARLRDEAAKMGTGTIVALVAAGVAVVAGVGYVAMSGGSRSSRSGR